jgi:uncharacterized protein (TIGR03437 family)
MTVQQAAPGILTYNGNRAVVQNQDYSINASTNAAKVGDVAIAYLIGLGPISPPIATGAFAPNSPPSNETLSTNVTIGGVTAPVIFSGRAPGFAGRVQINFRIDPGHESRRLSAAGNYRIGAKQSAGNEHREVAAALRCYQCLDVGSCCRSESRQAVAALQY